MVEYPRWFNLVFRCVGLMGEGDTGDLRGVKGDKGDLSDRVGLVICGAVDVEMLKDSFGLATREASMLMLCGCVCIGLAEGYNMWWQWCFAKGAKETGRHKAALRAWTLI